MTSGDPGSPGDQTLAEREENADSVLPAVRDRAAQQAGHNVHSPGE
jgi:hypothetical protein